MNKRTPPKITKEPQQKPKLCPQKTKSLNCCGVLDRFEAENLRKYTWKSHKGEESRGKQMNASV